MKIKLLPHQYKAIYSPYKHTCLSGGVGSGKTYGGVQFCLVNIAQQPKTVGLIVANTYQQLKDVSVYSFLETLDDLKMVYTFNKNEMTIQIGESLILARSAEKHQNWKGLNLGWAWMDEAAFYQPTVYETVLARLRHPKASRYRTLITTTPLGFNWIYDYYLGEKKTDEHHLIRAKTKDNKYLPEDFEKSLRDQYSSKLSAQELDGDFVALNEGNVYWAFDRGMLRELSINTDSRIYIGMDFNVGLMCAACVQIVNGVAHVFDEIVLKNSNTMAMAREIKKRYGTGVKIIPDSTGRKATTNASRSDHEILKEEGFRDITTANNPYRLDRYAVVNSLLEKGRVIIDPRCKYLIKDLEQVAFKKGSNSLDDSDKNLSHISDALGYALYRTINPFKKKPRPIYIG